ncbi:MAG: hypothetical protein EOO15_10220 [Chitinophagaceae bacterium]|nr:MAG: hypothetical protein EOO15_10220 [Chitinophagaceae bacterium]
MSWNERIEYIVDNGAGTWKDLHNVLNDMKSAGLTAQHAIDILNPLLDKYRDQNDEAREEQILSLLDIAYGWCQPRYSIWD